MPKLISQLAVCARFADCLYLTKSAAKLCFSFSARCVCRCCCPQCCTLPTTYGKQYHAVCPSILCSLHAVNKWHLKNYILPWRLKYIAVASLSSLKFSDLTNLSLSNDIIPVSSSARNLGFIFDSDKSFSEQINSVSKSCHFHIRDICRIRHLLPLSAATALANSLVSSKLDYCNSLYSGISQSNLNKLQRIQNSLARVITNTSKYQHINHN